MRKPSLSVILLWPASWLYGIGVGIRNGLFDLGILRSASFPTCVIVVGNLSAGGTGKTPHVIALAKLLAPDFHLAILSRGYHRKTTGFRWVQLHDSPDLCGDEPLEIKAMLPHIPVAVCENRRKGMQRLLSEMNPKPRIVLLDDGFQHRYLKADYSLLLTREGRLFTDDFLLPAGRLREPASSAGRAQAVCVSHTTAVADEQQLRAQLRLRNDQLLLQSSVRMQLNTRQTLDPDTQILLVTAIAFPDPLLNWLQSAFNLVQHLKLRDHHRYHSTDIQEIITTFKSLPGPNKFLVTTGKDLVKLKQFEQIRHLPLLIADLEILFNKDDQDRLLNEIKAHVRKD